MKYFLWLSDFAKKGRKSDMFIRAQKFNYFPIGIIVSQFESYQKCLTFIFFQIFEFSRQNFNCIDFKTRCEMTLF